MTIDNYKFAGKKAIVRVDFNVPLDENGKITDDTRIRGALPTLKKILADGGALIIMSHMGKPKGKVNPKFSLSQIVDAVSEKLGVAVKFAPDCAKATDAAAALQPGEVLLLENLRFYPEEEGKPVGIDKEDPAYEDANKAIGFIRGLLRKRRVRNGSPQTCLYGCHRRLFRCRQQDARLSDGERSERRRQRIEQHQTSVHGHHGRL